MYDIEKNELQAVIETSKSLVRAIENEMNDLENGTHIEKLMSYNFLTFIFFQCNIFKNINSSCMLTGKILTSEEFKEDKIAQSWVLGTHPLLIDPNTEKKSYNEIDEAITDLIKDFIDEKK